MSLDKGSKVFIAGHRGLVGSAITRKLIESGYSNLVLRTRDELDLLSQQAVFNFFKKEQITHVFMAAAKVGGIYANNSAQADFLLQNLVMATNVIQASAENYVEKLLFLGSSCIYPKLAPQPLKESSLLTGPLEPTNEGYALAKIAGLKLCEMYKRQYAKNFVSAMPTNLYGPGDNFHPLNSHVIPGMMRRFHEAKISNLSKVIVWGTGTPKREFLHVEDLADALFLIMDKYSDAETINVGSSQEVTILELAHLMKEVVGFKGEIELDLSKPDGTPRKILDSTKINKLGWSPRYSLKEGLKKTYDWALKNKSFE